MRSRTVMADMRGTVRVLEHGPVRIHTYISPEDGLLTNTPIVEGPTRLIIFDGQFFLPYAREAALYARSLGKPVERIILSHIHLDHWSGLGVLAEHFPEAPLYAPRGVADYLRNYGQKILNARRPVFGDKIPMHPTIPTEVLPEGKAEIDGINFEFRRYEEAESALQLITLLPDQRTLFVFDLAFAPNHHVFTVTSHFDNWGRILAELNALPTYDTVLSGHGNPTNRAAIGATMSYLAQAKIVHAGARDAATYAARMKAAFPDREHPSWIDIAASLLYSVVDAYDTEAGPS